VTIKFDERLTKWAETANPFYGGVNADLLSMLPFAVLAGLLYLVGREALLSNKPSSGLVLPGHGDLGER
jgi:hypothetical protein